MNPNITPDSEPIDTAGCCCGDRDDHVAVDDDGINDDFKEGAD